jgi:contact-dependent growth inhibition (CDI) system CdiA-like toxin
MTSSNPLVAGAVSTPVDPWAGVWIAEDIETILAGVRGGSWIETSLGAVSAGLDALAFVSDPVGALLQYGVAWIIEHVKPLSEALDWLAGDPAEIAGHAQTWRNVAAALGDRAEELGRAARWDTAEWSGAAGEAYRRWGGLQQSAVGGLAGAAETLAAITEGAGMLVAGVRMMVRDAIAVLVSRLISYAAEEVFSLGLATPLVVEQVSSLCAAWAARIARWLKDLIGSLARLRGLAGKIGEAIEALKKLLRRLTGGGSGSPNPRRTTPSGRPDPTGRPRGKRTKAHPTRTRDLAMRRENESADVLAQNGYDVEQNPPTNQHGKNPDYKIEGEYFDCYAPQGDSLDNIRKRMSFKIHNDQTERIVLNLEDTSRMPEEIAAILHRRPMAGLKELLVVKDGKVTPLYPFSE